MWRREQTCNFRLFNLIREKPMTLCSLGKLSILLMSVALCRLDAQVVCPGCWNDIAPLSGHGAAPDGSGRRVIYVMPDLVSLNEDIGIVTKVQGALASAMATWNGLGTCYYLTSDLPQGQSVDIYVGQSSAYPSACAVNDVNAFYMFQNYPHHIYITSSLLNPSPGTVTQGNLAQILAHELGHSLGLTDAAALCNGLTIMGQANFGCAGAIQPVPTARDAAKSNQNCTNRSSCDWSHSQDPTPLVFNDQQNCPGNYGCSSQGSGFVEQDACYYDYGCNTPSYNATGNCCYPTTPILIDVDGKGFDLSDAAHGVLFDFLGNGTKVRLAWTAPRSTNAWLVLDRNTDGKIDSGREMFGNLTDQPLSDHANGYLALAEFDKVANGGNEDGVIDEHDRVFTKLRLWQDENHNGISEAGELHPLPELGVRSISVNYEKSQWEDEFGNRFTYRSKVGMAKGSQVEKWSYDVFLVSGK